MELKQTPLTDEHRALGAKMIDFHGWEMPVQYEGPIPEHLAVRTAAGMFDVSHMGEIEIKGHDALKLVQKLTCNDASKLSDGQIQYSAITYPQGTFVDDVTVHRFNGEHFFLCVNASNTDKDFEWIKSQLEGEDVEVLNTSANYCQIALQGPNALRILQRLTDAQLEAIKYYWFIHGRVDSLPALIARTGYTGEDGFEIYVEPDAGPRLWRRLIEAGREDGLAPAGLAARNTLRIEARMALYGNDIDETTTVLEADLGWICKLDKGDFIGRDALIKQKEEGIKRKLIGFEMLDRAPARDHYPVVIDGREVGEVTSGSPAPYLKKNIGLTYLPIEHCSVGTTFSVMIRGRAAPAQVVATPFYKRKK